MTENLIETLKKAEIIGLEGINCNATCDNICDDFCNDCAKDAPMKLQTYAPQEKKYNN